MLRLVIKIGGSFLTKKSLSDLFPASLGEIRARKDQFIDWRWLRSISREIRHISESSQIMVVHGAGPFGHALVKRSLTGATVDPIDIHRSMLVLNSAVVEALSGEELKCRTTSPFDTVTFDGTFVVEGLASAMKKDADKGLIPVSHGDVVPAISSRGRLGNYEVISGDIIVKELALSWGADRMIMVTDVDGILDRDPSAGPGARIPRIGHSECLSLLRGRAGRGADVTGGVLQKISDCEKPIRAGIPLHIVSGRRKGDLLAAATGADVGTVVEAR